RPHARRFRRSQRCFQFFFDNRIDQSASSLSNEGFEARDLVCTSPFIARDLPVILRHSVILRHPPPSGRSCWLTTAPDDDALSTFPPDSREYLSNDRRSDFSQHILSNAGRLRQGVSCTPSGAPVN